MNRRQLSARLALCKAKQRQRFRIWLALDPGTSNLDYIVPFKIEPAHNDPWFPWIFQVFDISDVGPLEMNNTSSMYAQNGLVRIDDSPVVREITK